ncbi:hypothetical protein F4780DRAFT_561209 [Xylariomycetidae sp. FL0641]|nr:hypothetical protein F4780DRAFT_561209 [Xylariomycetidae sp. FL0641]
MAPDTLSLANKVAIVTGSGREPGIGAGVAIALARNGAAVALNYKSDSTGPKATALAERLKSEFGVPVTTIQSDVTSDEGAKSLVDQTLKAFKTDKIDILINNAGCNLPGGTLDASVESIQTQFSINTFAAVFMVRAVVPHMPRGGRVVNVSSVASKLGMKGIPFYSAAKAALDCLTYTWADEFGRSHGITFNSIGPGPVESDEQKKFARDNPDGFKAVQHLIDISRAEDRMGTMEDIADAVLLLVQEKSRWITGQHLSLSGGITGG